MIIKSLKSEPEIFSPITFTKGINIITGERSGNTKSGNKTNGVGKTLLTQFIDFCLLADYRKNRISKVPAEVLPYDVNIILQISCGDTNIVISRSRRQEKNPTIIVNEEQKFFLSLEDARKYLSKKIFGSKDVLGLREMLRVFKRKEKDGFNKIDNPDGVKSLNIIPYLYLFGMTTELYKCLNEKAEKLIESHKYSTNLKKDIEDLGINIKEAPAYVNDLNAQLEEINLAVEELSQHKLYDTISEEISTLDKEIKVTNIELINVKEEIKQIESIPEYQEVSKYDIRAIFNDCKKSLGDMIVKEIEEIEEFKRIIDNFKLDVMNERKKELIALKDKLVDKLKMLSDNYKNKLSVIDKEGKLKSLKTTLHEQRLKENEYKNLTYLYKKYQEQENNKHFLKSERDDALNKLRADKEKQLSVIASFENKVLEMHQYLYGNHKASFDIELKEPKRLDQKTFINFHMETDDSGSVRTEHEKILIFDFCLLFCQETRNKHPKFLIHDGGFEGVNEDSKFQILNWLHSKYKENVPFQYIVTINRDSFEDLEKGDKFTFDLNEYVRAEYTKARRFLKQKYIEEKKSMESSKTYL